MRPSSSVDEYIAALPAEAQAAAKKVRAIITKAAPKETQEKVSYGMPYYGYKGRLIYWGAWQDHIGLYVMDVARDALADEIAPYRKAKATLHFPLDQPLPEGLITKIVKVQAVANAERHK
jgi:uncharacterized protein YdhG (YjbR/CyaY superfamily)